MLFPKPGAHGLVAGLATGGPAGRPGIKIKQDKKIILQPQRVPMWPMGNVERTVCGLQPLIVHMHLLCGGVAHTKAPS